MRAEKVSNDMVTSFRVNAELWKEARIYAIENGITMKKLLEVLLQKELEEKKIKKELHEKWIKPKQLR